MGKNITFNANSPVHTKKGTTYPPYFLELTKLVHPLKRAPSTPLSQPWEFQCRAVAQTGSAVLGLTVG